MREQIRTVIARVLGIDEAGMPPEVSPATVGGWDSLHHFELMLALEQEFGVKIRSADMPTLTSDATIEDYLRSAASVRA